jgi:TolB-like protein/Flp pilus assembly protein TadD
MGDLWQRLRARRIVQWLLAYLAGAWLLVQVVHVVGEQFGLPVTALRSVTTVLAVGALAAMVIAWYHGEEGRQRVTGPELVMLCGILIIAGSSLAMVRGQTERSGGMAVAGGAAGLQSFPASREKSIGVLPFANLSEERANEHFSDGLTEELIMDLARMTSLRVISRTSAMRFKDTELGVREIGDELGVAYVVAGSVRRDGDRVRITAQLIDARTDQHVWSNSYDSQLDDIFSIQRNIAAQIATSLRAALPLLASGEGSSAQPTQNLQAYQLYLEGKHLYHNRFGTGGADRLARSAIVLQQAVELDPRFARAWAALALTHATVSGAGGNASTSGDEAAARAQTAAAQAVALDPNAADAYVARGMLHIRRLHWAEAERSFLAALQAEPQNAPAHDWYGTLLVSVGRSQEAERILRRSAELDPVNARTLHWLADALRNSGKMDESRLQAQRSVDLGMPVSSIGVYLYHLLQQEWEQAITYQEAALRGQRQDPAHVRAIVAAVRDPSLTRTALDSAAAVRVRDPDAGRNVYAFLYDLADPTAALDAMEDMIQNGEGLYSLWRVWEPRLAHVRNHPRFHDIARRTGLIDYWSEHGWPDLCRPEGETFACR